MCLYLHFLGCSQSSFVCTAKWFQILLFIVSTHLNSFQVLLFNTNNSVVGWVLKYINPCQLFNAKPCVCVCVCVCIYIYTQVKVKLATVVEGNQKAPFSIATTPRCRGGCYSFPWIAPFYP